MTPPEHIAQAIYQSRNGHVCKPWAKLPQSHKAPYMADAEAALSALPATMSAKIRELAEELKRRQAPTLPVLDRRFLEFIRDYPPADMALWHSNDLNIGIPARLWPRFSQYVETDPSGLVIFKLNEAGRKALEQT